MVHSDQHKAKPIISLNAKCPSFGGSKLFLKKYCCNISLTKSTTKSGERREIIKYRIEIFVASIFFCFREGRSLCILCSLFGFQFPLLANA